jgi:uncharacterized protein (TIGR03382 family)
MSRLAIAVSMVLAAPVAARPIDGIIDQGDTPGELTPAGLIPYNTLFLNRCASGCPITVGTSNSQYDRWQIPANATLTKFPFGDTAWSQVVECVKDVMSPYNIRVTDVDPGTANHFEVMIAGLATDIGLSADYGGVAPGGCMQYHANALVFDFAKVWSLGASTCNQACIEDICSTAAQEIGHVWKSMDHVIVAADPMTYNPFTDRRYFQNTAAQCGSDCKNGYKPNSTELCDGPSNQNHSCRCNGGETQNSFAILNELFGPGANVTPPTATFTTPLPGASVKPGFSIIVDGMDDSGRISRFDVTLDTAMVGSSTMKPAGFTASTTLGVGDHHLEVTAYDPYGFSGKATVDVFVGGPCNSAADCTHATDVCVAHTCVGGPDIDGGLGTTCTMATECFSAQCAVDGAEGYCVEQCEPGQCPDGFGCREAGGQQICWPGYDEGGCGCSSNRRGGPLSLALVLLVAALTWRRRR